MNNKHINENTKKNSFWVLYLLQKKIKKFFFNLFDFKSDPDPLLVFPEVDPKYSRSKTEVNYHSVKKKYTIFVFWFPQDQNSLNYVKNKEVLEAKT